MAFNSLEFLIFFVLVYALYRTLRHKVQNRMLLVASYIFYGFWDWRFLGLIWLSTVVDYFCGLAIEKAQSSGSSGGPGNVTRQKRFLAISIIVNLSILGFFKYFNFFSGSLSSLASSFGLELDYVTLNIVLPVGISFYTFQTLSYSIDIYRKQLKPTRDFLDFSLYVAFFPQLVAGPIERARRLLPQISKARTISDKQFYEGLWLILWGLFKKIFIADNLAMIVDSIFGDNTGFTGAEVLMASYAFAFQIYGDFSGYSDIARGLSKLMGFELMINFRFPYFVTNPREFWRNWHISLSTWLRDYLYISLGGNRSGNAGLYRNLMITMLLGGLWHGASWTFVIWGLFHGIILSVHRIIEPALSRFNPQGAPGALWLFLKIIFMFHITCFGWLIFRADGLSGFTNMTRALFSSFLSHAPTVPYSYYLKQIIFYTALLLIVQLYKLYKKDMYAPLHLPSWLRWPLYMLVLFSILLFGEFGVKQFIYFQF